MPCKVHAFFDDPAMTSKMTGSSPDFSTSLKHLISWMRLFGIPLGVKQVRSKWWSVWLGCYSLAFFVLNVANDLAAIWLFFSENRDKSTARVNRVLNWNTMLATLNFSLTAIGINVTLLSVTSVRWESLIAALSRISCVFQTADYRKFQNRCTWGLAINITVLFNVW